MAASWLKLALDMAAHLPENFSTTETSLTLEERSDNNKYFSKDEVPQCGAIQYKIGFSTTGNDAPQLESLRSDYEEEAVI